MIIQEIRQIINDKTIIGRFKFEEWVESNGKRETNIYIVEIFQPMKSVGGLSISRSFRYEKFTVKEEAIKYFNREFKKITKNFNKPVKKRVIDERYNYDEIKKERTK